MNNTVFMDMSNDGHHFSYNLNIFRGNRYGKKVYFTTNLTGEQKDELTKNNVEYIEESTCKTKVRSFKVLYFIKKFLRLKKVVKSQQIDKIVFLHLDGCIIPLGLIYGLLYSGVDTTATLHWYTNSKIKQFFLKKLAKKGLVIIVHTEDVKYKLNSIGIDKVNVIKYPILKREDHSRKICIEKIGMVLNEEYKTILYFGGTRYDKGIDILLNSIKKCKSKFNLIIAGKEEVFSKEFIEENISDLVNVNSILKLGYVPDDLVEAYFKIADIVVLPYRSIFNGESGILTEAINNKDLVIVPDIIHFPQIIKKYNNGLVYKCENIEDLSNKIDIVINNYNDYIKGAEFAYRDYLEEHSIDKFIKTYENTIIQ